VLKGAPKPSLLADKINYEVMGANTWKHAPSIRAAANDRLRLYINSTRTGNRYKLRNTPGSRTAGITHIVNLADRSDVDAPFVGGLLDTVIATSNGVVLVSDPLKNAVEMTGLLSGHLELIGNKKDFDFTITPYELTKDGRYFQLAPFTSRASNVASLSARHLLKPGKLERLDFREKFRMISRELAAGSRVVIVLAGIKNPGQQINYGTGKNVSDESVADAKDLLTIRWMETSYFDLPIRH